MGEGVKALIYEDTLLRTVGKHLLRTQNVSEQNQEHFLCPRHKICVRNKCCARGQTRKHLCRQQSVLVCQGLKGLWFPPFEFPFPLTLASPPTSLVVHSSWCFLLLQNTAQNFSLFLPIPVTLGIPVPTLPSLDAIKVPAPFPPPFPPLSQQTF